MVWVLDIGKDQRQVLNVALSLREILAVDWNLTPFNITIIPPIYQRFTNFGLPCLLRQSLVHLGLLLGREPGWLVCSGSGGGLLF